MTAMKKAPARRMVAHAAKPKSAPKKPQPKPAPPVPAQKRPATHAPSAFVAPKSTVLNREHWLANAIELLRPEFDRQGSPIPKTVRASIGFASSPKAEGQCWQPGASGDGHHEIFIRPTVNVQDVSFLLGLLCHELCHAALPAETAHKRPFAELGRKMLLTGKPKHMREGEEFRARWAKDVLKLGPFPAAPMAGLNLSGGTKGNKKRKLKVCCPECEMTFRLAEKWISDRMQCPDRDCTGLLEVTAP